MPPPRIFCPRRAEREAEFQAARTQAEVQMLLRSWAAEDRGEHQIETARMEAVESAVVDERLTRLERQVAELQDALTGDGADALVEVLGKAFSIRDRRIAALEAEQLRFCGVHETGRTYLKNSLCVRQGSLWVATTATASTPGSGENSGWVMCVKRGSAANPSPVIA
jgi:hypothetical protein